MVVITFIDALHLDGYTILLRSSVLFLETNLLTPLALLLVLVVLFSEIFLYFIDQRVIVITESMIECSLHFLINTDSKSFTFGIDFMDLSGEIFHYNYRKITFSI